MKKESKVYVVIDENLTFQDTELSKKEAQKLFEQIKKDFVKGKILKLATAFVNPVRVAAVRWER